MRGRVLILVGIIVLGAVLVVAVLLLSSSGDGGGEDAEVAQEPTDPPPGVPTAFPTPTRGAEFAEVVIALQDLPRGRLITRSDLSDFAEDPRQALIGIRFWPLENRPQNSIRNPEHLIGCRVRSDIPRESPIVTAQLVPDPELAFNDIIGEACTATDAAVRDYGSDVALFMEPGTRAISVPLNPTGYGQLAYGFQKGDSVDVIMSFLFIDVDEEFQTRTPNQITVITRDPDGNLTFDRGVVGREEPSNIFEGVIVGPSESRQRPRMVTQRTITNAKVLHVGWFPEDGVIYGQTPTPFDPELDTILDPTAAAEMGPVELLATLDSIFGTDYIPVIMTLAVSPQDALVLTWAIDADIPISYMLRPAIEDERLDEQFPTEPVTLEYMFREFDIEAPTKLPITIEPAISDIRRFDLGQLSTFVDFGVGVQTGE